MGVRCMRASASCSRRVGRCSCAHCWRSSSGDRCRCPLACRRCGVSPAACLWHHVVLQPLWSCMRHFLCVGSVFRRLGGETMRNECSRHLAQVMFGLFLRGLFRRSSLRSCERVCVCVCRGMPPQGVPSASLPTMGSLRDNIVAPGRKCFNLPEAACLVVPQPPCRLWGRRWGRLRSSGCVSAPMPAPSPQLFASHV